MIRKYKRVVIVILSLIGLLITDRFLFMDDRIIDNNWSFESGHYIQDPIHFGQHCELKGDKVLFYKTGEIQKVIGCYLGQLILYDSGTNVLSRYSIN
jgi:hypothetical protein